MEVRRSEDVSTLVVELGLGPTPPRGPGLTSRESTCEGSSGRDAGNKSCDKIRSDSCVVVSPVTKIFLTIETM